MHNKKDEENNSHKKLRNFSSERQPPERVSLCMPSSVAIGRGSRYSILCTLTPSNEHARSHSRSHSPDWQQPLILTKHPSGLRVSEKPLCLCWCTSVSPPQRTWSERCPYYALRNSFELNGNYNTVQLDIESVSTTLKVKSNTASEWPTHHQHRPLMCLDGEVRRQGGL